MELLKKALSQTSSCNYFHLISGVDIPIRKKEEFDSFFTNDNISYLGLVSPQNAQSSKGRFAIYYLRNILNYRGNKFSKKLNDLWENIQFHILNLGIKIRPELNYTIYKESNWWSLNRDVASYIIDFCQENSDYLKRFRYTNCCDEVFFHVIIMNSKYKNKIIDNNLRYVDWNPRYDNESLPRTLTEEDWEHIKNSNALFCRKIDSHLSKGLIECIKKELL